MHAPTVSGSEMRGSSKRENKRFGLTAVAFKRNTLIL